MTRWLILILALAPLLTACDDGRQNTINDTPPDGSGQPAQDVERQPDKPSGSQGT